MNLEGVGAAILGGGGDADVLATMHGLTRCVCVSVPVSVFLCPGEKFCVALLCSMCLGLHMQMVCFLFTRHHRSIQRMLSVAADVHLPSGMFPFYSMRPHSSCRQIDFSAIFFLIKLSEIIFTVASTRAINDAVAACVRYPQIRFRFSRLHSTFHARALNAWYLLTQPFTSDCGQLVSEEDTAAAAMRSSLL